MDDQKLLAAPEPTCSKTAEVIELFRLVKDEYGQAIAMTQVLWMPKSEFMEKYPGLYEKLRPCSSFYYLY